MELCVIDSGHTGQIIMSASSVQSNCIHDESSQVSVIRDSYYKN